MPPHYSEFPNICETCYFILLISLSSLCIYQSGIGGEAQICIVSSSSRCVSTSPPEHPSPLQPRQAEQSATNRTILLVHVVPTVTEFNIHIGLFLPASREIEGFNAGIYQIRNIIQGCIAGPPALAAAMLVDPSLKMVRSLVGLLHNTVRGESKKHATEAKACNDF